MKRILYGVIRVTLCIVALSGCGDSKAHFEKSRVCTHTYSYKETDYESGDSYSDSSSERDYDGIRDDDEWDSDDFDDYGFEYDGDNFDYEDYDLGEEEYEFYDIE